MEIIVPKIEIDNLGQHIKYKYPDGEIIDVQYNQIGTLAGNQDTVNVTRIDTQGGIYVSSHNRTGRDLAWYVRYADNYPEMIIDRIKTEKGVVLDVATGQGKYVEDLRALGVEAYGLDLWLDPRQRALKHFLLGPAHRTGLPHNWAKLVIVNNVMHYSMADLYRREILQELSRVTMVTGSILVYPLSRQEKGRFTQIANGLSVRVVGQMCSELWEIRKIGNL